MTWRRAFVWWWVIFFARLVVWFGIDDIADGIPPHRRYLAKVRAWQQTQESAHVTARSSQRRLTQSPSPVAVASAPRS